MELPGFTEKVAAFGSVPVAKFGHCCCLITPSRLIVFGGASGNVNNFSITNDTFCLDMVSNPLNLTWRKLESKVRLKQRCRNYSHR
jgi:Galactose oxidase, central domain